MKCSQARRYMSLSMDGEMDEIKKYELSEHIKTCPDCSLFYEKMKSMDSSMKDIFCEKNMEEGFEERIIGNLPEKSDGRTFWEMIGMRKFKVLTVVAAVIVILIIPWGGKSVVSMLYNGIVPHSSKVVDLAAVMRFNDINYLASSEVIPDERIIDKEVYKVKKSITEENSDAKLENGCATMLPVGTLVYSLKGMDQNKALTAKFDGRWILYRAIDGSKAPVPLFAEDYMNAEKIVVTNQDGEKQVKTEVTDKNTIKSIAQYLKNAKPQDQAVNYYNAKTYSFYFYIKDSGGIGKVVPVYMVQFNDPALGGFICHDRYYRVTPEILKLLVPDVSGGYDAALGGSFQVYDVYVSPKVLIRRYIKDENGPKPEVKVINKGDKIWKDGKLADDDLAGNFKLMINMKGTTVQEGAAQKIKTDYKNIPGAVSISVTKGEKDSSVIYIGFDSSPKYNFDEFGESLMILIEK